MGERQNCGEDRSELCYLAYGFEMKSAGPMKKSEIPPMKSPPIMNILVPYTLQCIYTVFLMQTINKSSMCTLTSLSDSLPTTRARGTSTTAYGMYIRPIKSGVNPNCVMKVKNASLQFLHNVCSERYEKEYLLRLKVKKWHNIVSITY